MELKVIWSQSAEFRLDNIYKYYLEKASEVIAKKLVRGIINETQSLKKNPFIGQVEPLLIDRIETYRYLVIKNYKIIYSVDKSKNLIKIADVFDTRQNPEKLKKTN